MIKAAILGMGRWGQNLHQSVQGSHRIQISHACTRSPDKVKDYCAQHGLALTSRYESILADPDVDAVIIATPHTQHFEQIMQAAAAGKHVFCEKPFTLSGDQAAKALKALADNNLEVGIGHNRRFAANTRALKAMLDDNVLGEITYIDGMFSAQMSGSRDQWRDSRQESPAGGMTSLGIHVVDMFAHLCGDMVEVTASSERLRTQCAFDDTTVANIKFKSGITGVLTTLTSSPMQWCIRVYGTRGRAELHEQDTLIVVMDGDGPNIQQFPGYDYPALKSIGDCLEDFAAAVRGEKPFLIHPSEILHCTQVLDAIIRSAENGDSITL